MAAATATKTPKPGAGRWWAQFFGSVEKATGLDALVLQVWTLAEGANPANPFNIMNPATNKPYAYATPQQAAAATIKTLQDPRYAPVLRAAKTGQPKAQLDAIAASAWDRCHYRGTNRDGSCANAKPGTLLYGLWTDLVGGPPLAGSTHSYGADPASPFGKRGTRYIAGGGHDPQGNTTSGSLIDFTGLENWASGSAGPALLRGSLYLVFTVAAIGMIIVGLVRSSGGSVSAGVGGLARAPLSPEALAEMRKRPGTQGVPY